MSTIEKCPCGCEEHPPWWPSQLQGEPWNHLVPWMLPDGATDDEGVPLSADACAEAIVELQMRGGLAFEVVPFDDDIYPRMIAELNRRFEADDCSVRVDATGAFTGMTSGQHLRILRLLTGSDSFDWSKAKVASDLPDALEVPS